MTEEIRPYPFCGTKPHQNKEDDSAYPDCNCFGHFYVGEHWQTAWCWKEIDRLKEDNLAQRELLAKLDEAGIKLKAQNEKMREALKIIPPEKLRLLAQWVTLKADGNRGDVERDLELMADKSEEALKGE